MRVIIQSLKVLLLASSGERVAYGDIEIVTCDTE